MRSCGARRTSGASASRRPPCCGTRTPPHHAAADARDEGPEARRVPGLRRVLHEAVADRVACGGGRRYRSLSKALRDIVEEHTGLSIPSMRFLECDTSSTNFLLVSGSPFTRVKARVNDSHLSGLYAARSQLCDGKTLYECVDCSSADVVYIWHSHSDFPRHYYESADVWFIGAGAGCGRGGGRGGPGRVAAGGRGGGSARPS